MSEINRANWNHDFLQFIHNSSDAGAFTGLSASANLQTIGLIPAGSLKINEALQIYKNGYIARLTESMGEIYKSIWRVLGDQLFFAVCKKYILKNPSFTYNLSLYGGDFPSFLADYPSLPIEKKWLEAIAGLDLAFSDVFHRKLSTATPLAWTQSYSEATKFELISPLQFKRSAHKVYSFWKTRSEEASDQSEIGLPGDECIVIYKQALGVYSKKFELGAFQLLQGLLTWNSLEAAIKSCESELTSENVNEALQFVVASGAFQART